MAVESPPFAEQGSTYGAVVLRRAFGTLLQRGASIGSITGGLVGSGDMEVTAGSGMQVKVAPGEAWIAGSSVSNQSGYYARVESSTALAIAASSETNPRIDTVIAKVIDKAYAGSEETFSVAVVTGTAESGATLANKKGAGAVPASSLVLAYVLVPAKAVSIVGGDIENVAEGINRVLYVVGTATPTLTSGVGTIIAGSGYSGAGKYGTWANATNGFTVPSAGLYIVTSGTAASETLTGLVSYVVVNGAAEYPLTQAGTTGLFSATAAVIGYWPSGTVLGAGASQTSGSSKTVRVTLQIVRLGN